VLRPVREKARSEMEASDLYQSGIFGLSRAVSLYDVRSGSSFPVFANWWIRQKIFGSAKHSSPLIKLPGSVWEMYQKIKAAERRLEMDPEKRYSYTTKDIADQLETSVSSVEQVLRKIQTTKVVPLESLVHSSDDGSDDESSIDRALLDDSLGEETAYEDRRDFVERVLKHVDRYHRNLVCLRYGVLESVDNSGLDSKQVIKEIFRQVACKAVIQGTTAGAADDSTWVNKFTQISQK
jgi:DNA-directed RNA polymerase sigma subunit (sigma70/sigma32)